MPDLPELVALLYRADWKRYSLSARATQRRDKDVHRRRRGLAQAEWDQELGPVPGFLRPDDDSLYDGPEWPKLINLREAGAAAAMAAGGLIAGAGALTGWLAKRRARPDDHDRGS